MPIELITGKPGNSKTAFLVDRLMTESAKQGDERRTLVACGINGLVPGLADIVLQDPRTWSEIIDRESGPCTCPLYGGAPGDDGTFPPHTHRLPKGSLIFVDEAWKWFGHLHDASRAPTPKHALDLAEHRHMGVDFIWTAQGPNQIYPFVRNLIANHEHLVRRWGTKFIDVFRWEELQDDVKSVTKRENAQRSTKAIPTRTFGKYKSAEEHTIKAKIPLKVLALPIMLVAAVGLAWAGWHMLTPDAMAGSSDPEGLGAASAATAQSTTDPTKPSGKRNAYPSVEAYYAAHQARVPTLPWSAPIYDDRGVTSDPQLFCMSSGAGTDATGRLRGSTVTCMTEQGTPYAVDDRMARHFARWGSPYNPYRAKREDQGPEVTSDRRGSPRPATASMESSQVNGYGDLGVALKPGP